MSDVREDVNRSGGAPVGHAHHDRVLVSRYASDDAYEGEIEQARMLVEQCSDCASLAADIRTLSASLAVSEVPRRTRDFRISAERADQLRGSRLDRLFRRLAAPGLAPARPLAGVALSLGLALAVAGAALPTPTATDAAIQMDTASENLGPMMGEEPPGDPRSGGQLNQAPDDGAPAEGAVGEQPSSEHEPAPGAQPQATDANYGLAEERLTEAGAEDFANGAQATTPARYVLIVGGLAIALLSLGVLAMIIVARRRLHDPLLR
jgi:hypothetical protein